MPVTEKDADIDAVQTSQSANSNEKTSKQYTQMLVTELQAQGFMKD